MSHVYRISGFDPNKIYMLGEPNSGLESRGILQNYEELKSFHLQNGTLFEDPLFVPNEIELGDGVRQNEVKWLRPQEIRYNPKFITGGKDRFDINQGDLGDCWFLAALADVTRKPHILARVVPDNQSFDHDYAGIFHFRFWQYGRWIDIVIDDRLPTWEMKKYYDKVSRELVYVKSTDENEFWTPLLEKAYAKMYGSYKNLMGGFASEALEDLTGGLTEIHRKGDKNWNEHLFDKMLESNRKNSFMGCGIMHNNRLAATMGLVSSHSYSITGVCVLSSRIGDVKLLRIRNPWGQKEWRGNWSDGSEQWNTVADDIKADLFLRFAEDGEFWMEFRDFMECYDILELCHPNPDFGMNHWNSCILDGTWNANRDCPRYTITLEGEMNSMHIVIIGLMQKNRRVHHQLQLPIGFKILTLEGNVVYYEPPEYIQQVTGYMKLLTGTYVLAPFVGVLSERYCDYLIRIYSSAIFNVQ